MSLCGLVRLPSCEKDSEAVNNTIHFFLRVACLTKLSLCLQQVENKLSNKIKPFSSSCKLGVMEVFGYLFLSDKFES